MAERVVVVGASGFGRETLDTLVAMMEAGADLEIGGVIDDFPSEANLQRLDDRHVAYLGTLDDWLGSNPAAKFLLGIGDPRIRRQLVGKLESAGLRAFTAVHPSAIIGTGLTLGEGAIVCAGATISTNVRVGKHTHINPSVTIGHDTVLEDFVSVNPSAVLSGDVRIAEEVLVGAAATVLQGLTVSERAVIGAGAVVTKDVPCGVVAKGVPGRWQSADRAVEN